MIAKKVLNMGEKVLQTFSPMHKTSKTVKLKVKTADF